MYNNIVQSACSFIKTQCSQSLAEKQHSAVSQQLYNKAVQLVAVYEHSADSQYLYNNTVQSVSSSITTQCSQSAAV